MLNNMENVKKYNSSLNLILGRSGSGKSFYIKKLMKEALSNKEDKIMLIVPEQDSFETEKSILKFLGAEGANKVVVISFKRMIDFVFRQIGGLAGPRINDSGRNIFMKLAIEEVKEHMELYDAQVDSNEMVDIMVSALKEFKINSISTNFIIETSKKIKDKTLKKKISDTALILETYDSLIKQSYLDPLDDLTRLAKILNENVLFNNYKIFIDEFDGFTPQEFLVLENVLKQCKESYIALRVDDFNLNDNGMNLFSPVYKTLKQLIDLSNKNSIRICKPQVLTDQHRFNSSELKIFEKFIFRGNFESINDKVNDIVIYNALDPYDEINFVSNTIKKMIIEDGYYYNDFAIIARDLNLYDGIITSTLKKHEIPYFLDLRQSIDTKPIMMMVLSAFNIIHSSFKTEYIFTYLKTGIPNVNFDDISIIENYVMLWEINNKDWLNDFKHNPSGFSGKMSKVDEEILIKVNNIRKQIIAPILSFAEKIKDNNANSTTKAIYDLLIDVEADKKIIDISNKLENIGQHNLSEEQIRLWDLLMDILDQMSLILKDRYLDSKKYYEMLKLIIESEDISFIPQSLDEVTIGDADRIRLKDKKVVFIIGAVEGEFPRTPVPSGVFTDSERKLLISLGVPMYESLEKLVIEERFLAYTSMTSASDKLFLSWPMTSISGNSNYPSSIIKSTKKVFAGLNIKDELSLNNDYGVYSIDPTFDLCAKTWNSNTSFSESLKYYFKNIDKYKGKMQALDRASRHKPFKFEDCKNADKLFGKEMKVSASQIEKFYLCKFQYFCKYGLLAKTQTPYTFNSLEYGKLVHFLLEKILSKYSIHDLSNMNRLSIKALVDKYLDNYMEENLGGIEGKTKRFKYLLYRVNSVFIILLEHIIEEFSQSKFVPSDFELDISDSGDISPLYLKTVNGDTIKVQGKIDRVDVMKKDGKSYVRILDYKTGIKDFKLSDIIYGLNTQMLIYMLTVCKNGKSKYSEIVPAGVLYMPCRKPLISAEKNISESKLKAEINKKLKMNGLILDNPEVIKGMEKEVKGIFIPVSLKDGELKKFDSIANLAQMGSIMNYLEKLIISMAETLKSGDISADPIIGEYSACKYCEYKSVCGHEDMNVGKKIKKIDRSTTIKFIEESVGEKNDRKEVD